MIKGAEPLTQGSMKIISGLQTIVTFKPLESILYLHCIAIAAMNLIFCQVIHFCFLIFIKTFCPLENGHWELRH